MHAATERSGADGRSKKAEAQNGEEIKQADWRDAYGMAVVGLELPPSEVRQMTLGELYAVISAKEKMNSVKFGAMSSETVTRLAKRLKEAKAKEARAKECQTV